MSAQLCNSQHEMEGIQAAFMSNHRGEVCISFSDPVYARADSILVDVKKGFIYVIIHENSFFISGVSEIMTQSFSNNKRVLLTAVRPDGSLLELTAPIRLESGAQGNK